MFPIKPYSLFHQSNTNKPLDRNSATVSPCLSQLSIQQHPTTSVASNPTKRNEPSPGIHRKSSNNSVPVAFSRPFESQPLAFHPDGNTRTSSIVIVFYVNEAKSLTGTFVPAARILYGTASRMRRSIALVIHRSSFGLVKWPIWSKFAAKRDVVILLLYNRWSGGLSIVEGICVWGALYWEFKQGPEVCWRESELKRFDRIWLRLRFSDMFVDGYCVQSSRSCVVPFWDCRPEVEEWWRESCLWKQRTIKRY